MSTPAQIAANQANSKLSTGPTSEIGKQDRKREFCKTCLLFQGPHAPARRRRRRSPNTFKNT